MLKLILTSNTDDLSRDKPTRGRVASIESAVREDISEIADLAARTFSDRFGHMMSPEELKQFLQESYSTSYFKSTFSDTHILVARYGAKIVGYVQFGPVQTPKIPAGPGDKEIVRVYVETNLHGLGFGRQLLMAALTDRSILAAPNVFLKVWGENKEAIALYKSCGFKATGLTQFEIAGELARDVIMVL